MEMLFIAWGHYKEVITLLWGSLVECRVHLLTSASQRFASNLGSEYPNAKYVNCWINKLQFSTSPAGTTPYTITPLPPPRFTVVNKFYLFSVAPDLLHTIFLPLIPIYKPCFRAKYCSKIVQACVSAILRKKCVFDYLLKK